jgi:hypothetical protein
MNTGGKMELNLTDVAHMIGAIDAANQHQQTTNKHKAYHILAIKEPGTSMYLWYINTWSAFIHAHIRRH